MSCSKPEHSNWWHSKQTTTICETAIEKQSSSSWSADFSWIAKVVLSSLLGSDQLHGTSQLQRIATSQHHFTERKSRSFEFD